MCTWEIAAPLISFDIIYRYLRYLGYKVRYVRNITDAGHLEVTGTKGRQNSQKKQDWNN